MPSLIGNKPNQVPTNGDLGVIAFKDAVGVADMNATGTPSNTTFLRGDNSWQAVSTPTIASTGEAEAGINNTTFITPLRMREGFNASGFAPVYACRAWVNFDGTTSPGTIRASGNVSSVTKNGTGDYTVNFTTALPDINFSINGMCSIVLGNNVPVVFDNSTIRARTTTSSSIRTMDAGNFGDPVWVNIAVFR